MPRRPESLRQARNLSQQRVTIGQAIDEYLDFIKAHRKERTYVTYRYTLDKLLRVWCRRSFVDQITRDDILQFMTDCYKHGLGKRTVYDKLVVVLQLFKRYGKIKLIESTIGQSTSTPSVPFTKRKKSGHARTRGPR
jgi:site-specific recombinase XerD